jgi:transcriptional regulator with XRE-family HTH domain
METLEQKLGIMLKDAREKAGLTQLQVAEEMLLTKQRISEIEKGRARIPLSKIQRFCEVVGVEFSFSVDGLTHSQGTIHNSTEGS